VSIPTVEVESIEEEARRLRRRTEEYQREQQRGRRRLTAVPPPPTPAPAPTAAPTPDVLTRATIEPPAAPPPLLERQARTYTGQEQPETTLARSLALYRRVMPSVERMQDVAGAVRFTADKRAVLQKAINTPGGAGSLSIEEQALAAANTPEEYQRNLKGKDVPMPFFQSVVPEPAQKFLSEQARRLPGPLGKVAGPAVETATGFLNPLVIGAEIATGGAGTPALLGAAAGATTGQIAAENLPIPEGAKPFVPFGLMLLGGGIGAKRPGMLAPEETAHALTREGVVPPTRRPGPQMSDVEGEVYRQTQQGGVESPFIFPEPQTMTSEHIAAGVAREVDRIAENAPASTARTVIDAVRTFVNPEATRGEGGFITEQVWQNKYNRRMGKGMGQTFNDWEKSSKQSLFKVDKADEITTIPGDAGLSRMYGDVASNPSLYKQWLTPEQLEFFRKRGQTFEKLAQQYEDVTHERVPRRLGDEYYNPREVAEVRGREASRMVDSFDQREYNTMAEGRSAGVKYNLDSADVNSAHVRKMYNRMSDVITGREYANNIGKRPIDLMDPQLMEDVHVARTAFMETRKAVRTELGRNIRVARAGAAEAEKLVAEARRGETTDTRIERANVKRVARELQAAREELARAEGIMRPGIEKLAKKTAGWPKEQIPAAQARVDALISELERAKTGAAETRRLNVEAYKADAEAAAETLRRTERLSEAAVNRHPDFLIAKAAVNNAIGIAARAREAATKPKVGFERVSGRVGKGRIFPADIAREIMHRNGIPESPNGVAILSDLIFSPLRAVRATADYGVMFIQGYNPLVTHPTAWGIGMTRGLRQIAYDAGTRAKYIERNMGAISEMVRLGWGPRGAEYEVGGGFLHRAPILGRPARLFDELFSHPMNITAIEIYKIGKDIYNLKPEDLLPGKTRGQELADSITKMTGTVRYGGGVMENRTAFAAKFIRSLVGVAGDSLKSGIRGIEARRLFRNMFIVSSLGTILVNEAMGKPWTLDMRDSRAFTIPLGNKHVSLLGPWAPMFRGVARAVAGGPRDGPFHPDPLYLLTHTGRGKLAPGLSNFVDLIVGKTYMGADLDITNLKQTLGYLGQQFIPMSVGEAGQAIGSVDWSSPKDVMRVIGESALALSGARAFPVSTSEQIDWQISQMGFQNSKGKTLDRWGDLLNYQQGMAELDPEVKTLLAQKEADATGVYARVNAIETKRDNDISWEALKLRKTGWTHEALSAFADAIRGIKSESAIRTDEEFVVAGLSSGKAGNPDKQLYFDYLDFIGQGGNDGEAVGALGERYRAIIGPEKTKILDRQVAYDRNPFVRQFDTWNLEFSNSGYYDINKAPDKPDTAGRLAFRRNNPYYDAIGYLLGIFGEFQTPRAQQQAKGLFEQWMASDEER